MKYNFLTILILACLSLSSQKDSVGIQRFSAGSHLLSPDLGKYRQRGLLIQPFTSTRNIVGPVGLRYEYLISDKVGLGGEISFRYIEFLKRDSIENRSSNYTETLSSVHLFFRANFHIMDIIEEALEEKVNNLDCYVYAGAGFSGTKYVRHDISPSTEPQTIIKMALKTGIGVRFMASKNIALYSELGLGRPIFSLGITQKIY